MFKKNCRHEGEREIAGAAKIPVVWKLVFERVDWQSESTNPLICLSTSAYAGHKSLAHCFVAFIDPEAADDSMLPATTSRGTEGCVGSYVVGIMMLETCW